MVKATGLKVMKIIGIIPESKRLLIRRKMVTRYKTQNDIYQERKCMRPLGNFSDPSDTEQFVP